MSAETPLGDMMTAPTHMPTKDVIVSDFVKVVYDASSLLPS